MSNISFSVNIPFGLSLVLSGMPVYGGREHQSPRVPHYCDTHQLICRDMAGNDVDNIFHNVNISAWNILVTVIVQ